MKPKNKSSFLFELLKQTFTDFNRDKVLKMASSLAYATILALPGLVIVLLWIAGIFYDPAMVEQKFLVKAIQLIGLKNVQSVQEILINTKFDYATFWAKLLAVVTLLLSVTGIFGEIQDSINTIWGLKVKPRAGILKIFINRLLSFSVLLSLGFTLIVSLLLNALITGLFSSIQHHFPNVPILVYYIVNEVVICIVLILLFGAIFKVLPDAKIAWKDILLGAVFTTVLFSAGKYVIGFFLAKNAAITAYGSAGSVIIILLWVYYSSVILYLGAEFTQVYLKLKNRHIQPNRYAVWVEKKDVAVDSNTYVEKENAEKLPN
jgi:membrane protein